MKTRNIAALVGIMAAMMLGGCKPKPVTVSGQIFIVTQGGENVKLGDIEIALLDKSEVTSFLANKLPAIEREGDSYRTAYEEAETNSQAAKAKYDLFESIKPDKDKEDYATFLSSKLFDSYPNFSEVKHEIVQSKLAVRDLNQYSVNFLDASTKALNSGDYVSSESYSKQSSDDSEQASAMDQQADEKLEELQQFIDGLEATYFSSLTASQDADLNAQATLANCPTPGDYFNDFFPNAFETTRSDADGKFSFAYPKSGRFTIFAKADRRVVNGTEEYYWLIDAPTNSGAAQIFLSNDNLVYNDPSGYFKIPPKEQAGTPAASQ